MQVDRKGLLNATTIKIQRFQDGQVVQTIILNNAAFQTKDLDTYDSDCDDISNAKAILMANISNYGSNVFLEANKEQNNESVTAELERYKEQVKTFEQRLNIDLNSHKKMNDSQLDILLTVMNPMSLIREYVVGNKMHKAFPLPGESSHWQYKFPLLVEGVPTARRMEIPLPGVCTAMMKKLPVKDRWQLH
nr:hypothetical protein [Tanacetum cinerariifolium]GFA41685.1 hypothetical protein [Tanacetum cinerariifolium]